MNWILAANAPVDPEILANLKRKAFLAAVLVTLICLLISVGWLFGISWLRSPLPQGGGFTMAAALSLSVLGLLEILSVFVPDKLIARLAFALAALPVVGVSLAKSFESINKADLGLEFILVNPFNGMDIVFPGIMPITEALPVAGIGMALILKQLRFDRNWNVRPYQVVLLLMGTVSIILVVSAFSATTMTVATSSNEESPATELSQPMTDKAIESGPEPKAKGEGAGSVAGEIVTASNVAGKIVLCMLDRCAQFPLILSFVNIYFCFAMLFGSPEDGFLRIAASSTPAGDLSRQGLILVLVFSPLLFGLKSVLEATKIVNSSLASTISMVVFIVAAMRLRVSAKATDPIAATQLAESLSMPMDGTIISQVGQAPLPMVGSSRNKKVIAVCDSCKSTFDSGTTTCPNDGELLVFEVQDALVGTLFAEKYSILSVLGEGGMSTVYLADHQLLSKHVAIKLMQSQLLRNANSVRRFQQEAKATSRLSHPNIMTLIDFGLFDGQPYMVVELLEGKSLSEVIRERSRLPEKEFIEIMRQVVDGIGFAHEKNIIHRDLKPSNIMLVKPLPGSSDGESSQNSHVKLVDFGLAKDMVAGEDSFNLTQTGECVGSPYYMSPEQCLGKQLDARSDLYALGCVMYECLVGVPPLRGNSALEVLSKHMSEAPEAIPDDVEIDNRIREVIFACLAKDENGRPDSAEAIKAVLEIVYSERYSPDKFRTLERADIAD